MKNIILLIALFLTPFSAYSAVFDHDLDGRILLAVEENGESWYVDPVSLNRFFLGRPDDAFFVMKRFGLGISNQDLKKIPVALASPAKEDRDKDGIPDYLEEALGLNPYLRDTDFDGQGDYEEILSSGNPWSADAAVYDGRLSRRLAGRILLQVEKKGEAWYVDRDDFKRYYLGRPSDAFFIMKELALGVKSEVLSQIPLGMPEVPDAGLEELIHRKINQARTQNGLKELAWNPDLAKVARMHSENLRRENQPFTALDVTCDYPLIHHEGIDFGLYSGDRLRNQGINYFAQSGENIIRLNSVKYSVYYDQADSRAALIEGCAKELAELDSRFKSRLEAAPDSEKAALIRQETGLRADLLSGQKAIKYVNEGEYSLENLAEKSVSEWLDSPGHRKNILYAEYDETGIGISFWNGYMVATQVFIRRIDCGFQNGPCCRDDQVYCYLPNSCDLSSDICR